VRPFTLGLLAITDPDIFSHPEFGEPQLLRREESIGVFREIRKYE
jgi:hypothetical protein